MQGTVCSSLPSATALPFIRSLVVPPVPGFGASAVNSNRTSTGPVGNGAVDVSVSYLMPKKL